MRLLATTPTEGLTCEMVSETVSPIIYIEDQLIQSAEVFVAIPMPGSTPDHSSDGVSDIAQAPSILPKVSEDEGLLKTSTVNPISKEQSATATDLRTKKVEVNPAGASSVPLSTGE
jgi:hypothetical protein